MDEFTAEPPSPTPPVRKGWRITYNARFTLSFCLISALMLLANLATKDAVNQLFALLPQLSLKGSYRMISYIFCHANFEHLLGNLLFLLLLGPILEEKYGSLSLAIMTLVTAIITGLVNALLFHDAIIGASGIVFMFIILSSIVNVKQREIPLSFIFIALIYLGGEVLNSFEEDNISQFGHIAGGLCGGVFGYLRHR